jgi:hypothetical protein
MEGGSLVVESLDNDDEWCLQRSRGESLSVGASEDPSNALLRLPPQLTFDD